MKFLFLFLLVLISYQPTILFASENSESEDRITYRICISPDNTRLAEVSVSFSPKDSLLYMAPGANTWPTRWAKFLHKIKAVDAEGNPVELEDLGDARWRIDQPTGRQITVSYEVHLEHDDYEWSGGIDGAAYATDWGVFYTGRSLLMLHGDNWEEIRVNFELPKSWKVTTPWNVVENKANQFSVYNQSSLAQSMIFAGTHEEISFQREDFELVFALGGEEVLSEKDSYKEMASGVLDYYIQLMGGIPNPAPDDPLTKAVVIINSGAVTDGEVIGNNISMLVEKDGNPMSKMISKFIFAHEFFHLWNGKSFRPVNESMEWFKEGFSNYYTLKALHQVGFIDENGYFEVLNNLFFQRYHTDEGVGVLSMTRGEEKHDHWGLIYGGGLFVAVAQDMIIRQATSNEKSIDHLMKALFQKYGGTLNTYDLGELSKAFSDLSGLDQSEFMDTYVTGATRIPIEKYLSMASLSASIEEGQLKISKKESGSALEENMTKGLLGDTDF